MPAVDAVSAMQASQSSMASAAATNIVESTDILSTDSATATMDISGSLDHASPAEPTRPTMELYVSATLATPEMSMETVSNLTLPPTATTTNVMMLLFKPAFVFLEQSTLEELARPSPLALKMDTSMAFNASAILTSSYKTDNASQPMLLYPHALPTHSSTVSHAPAIPVSSKATSMPALPVLLELHGTVLNVLLVHLVPMDTFLTQLQVNANLQELHAVPMQPGTELLVSAAQATTSSTDNAKNAPLELPSMEANAQAHPLLTLPLAIPTRSM